jgi:hypothetical protein
MNLDWQNNPKTKVKKGFFEVEPNIFQEISMKNRALDVKDAILTEADSFSLVLLQWRLLALYWMVLTVFFLIH